MKLKYHGHDVAYLCAVDLTIKQGRDALYTDLINGQ
jgi:hypothetical protein